MSDIDTNSDEFKQAVAEAVAGEVEGLKRKNGELIDQVKKLRKQTEIDPAEVAALEAERDDWKAKANEATKAAAKATKAAEDATKRAADIDTAYAGSIKDAALTEALSKAGVTPALLKAAKALHGSALQVVDENGVRTVKAGDKALAEFITEWAGSDEGKHFVAAPDSNGGGAHGSQRPNPNAPRMTRHAFEALAPAAQMEHIQKQGVVTD